MQWCVCVYASSTDLLCSKAFALLLSARVIFSIRSDHCLSGSSSCCPAALAPCGLRANARARLLLRSLILRARAHTHTQTHRHGMRTVQRDCKAIASDK